MAKQNCFSILLKLKQNFDLIQKYNVQYLYPCKINGQQRKYVLFIFFLYVNACVKSFMEGSDMYI